MSSMEHKPPRKSREVLLDVYYLLIPLISVNLYWLLLSLPIVTAPASIGALFYTTNQIAKGDSVNWGDFWDAFRSYFWVSLRWFLLDIAVMALLYVNITFYGTFSATWAVMVQGLMIGLAVLWLVIQCYVPSVIAMQEKRSIRLAMRNAAGLVAYRPLVMGPTAIAILAFYFLSIFVFPILLPLWIFITASLGAYFLSLATLKTVQRLVAKQNKENPPAGPTPPAG